MNETLTNFRQAVSDSADLQEKVKAGADLVALGKSDNWQDDAHKEFHDPISSVETAAKGEVERQAVLNASASCLNKVAVDVQGAALGNQ
jgi:hypothetical protein